MPLKCDTGPEAKKWLATVAAPQGFAFNRFASKEEAIAFVDELYRRGAQRVFVPDDVIRDYPKLRAEVGGATADSLVIVLPADEERRKNLLKAYLEEAASEGYDDMSEEEAVVDGKYLYLWWD